MADGKVVYRRKLVGGIAARSAVGILADGRVVLVATESDPFNGMSLCDLALFLTRNVPCRLALNLDGGMSTQLYVETAGLPFQIAGRDAIRTALAVFPRTTADVAPAR